MKFIHFGCWNKGFCNIDKPDNGLSLTMKRLNEYVKSEKIEFITIAGDNYYPDKIKKNVKSKEVKEKYFNPENFYSGLNCLPKGIKKYVALGNHEIEDSVFAHDTSEIQICYSLLKQKDFGSREENMFDLFNDVISFKIDNDTTLMLIIDTTLYENMGVDDEINLENTCYRHIFPKTPAKNINELIEYQENKILNIIKENSGVKNIIFVAHHPIASMSYNADKDKPKNEFIKRLCDFLCSLEYNIYYLCADTHFYQEGKINGKINQYIVGTGGAEQDGLPQHDNFSKNGVSYTVSKNLLGFGFIVVDVTRGIISVEFISAFMHGGRKYVINKINKYIKKIELL